MTLVELKAAAYDTIANIEFLQKQLTEINTQIANFKEEPKDGEIIEPPDFSA